MHGLAKLPKPGAKMRRIDILGASGFALSQLRRADTLSAGVPFDDIPAAMIYFTGDDVRDLSSSSFLPYAWTERTELCVAYGRFSGH